MISQGLKGKVALVAGATRRAGRGIAVQLGAAERSSTSPATVNLASPT
jgi:NAD(P)-dependent dehydrogenase (short-subunit alcohol dehydrogenase family)